MFHHRRHLRRWAARMLVVWLFGIAAGVANACVSAGSQTRPAAWVDASMPAHAGEAIAATANGSQGALNAASGHGDARHDGAPVNANCQDFCGKTSISVPSASKSPFDAACVPCVPPPRNDVVAVTAWAQPIARLADPSRRAGPSITIAYLHLAL